jgi:hypothetical protein
MVIEQTIEIPANRRVHLDFEVPQSIPAGRASVTVIFPSPDEADEADAPVEPCPLCAKYTDPVTGERTLNAETIAALEEGEAILRGEIPAKRYHSAEEMWADLDAELAAGDEAD